MEEPSRRNMVCPEWLDGFESPFIWHASQVTGSGSQQGIQRAIESLNSLKQEPGFSLEKIGVLLKLVLYYCLQWCEGTSTVEDLSQSWQNLRAIEELLEEENKGDDEFYKQIKLAVEHVTLATKAHLLAISNQDEESRQISACIPPLNAMSNCEKAAVFSMKAMLIMNSGYENGKQNAVDVARQVIQLDPDCALYKFQLALGLVKVRRLEPFTIQVPTDEEIGLFESAYEQSKNPKHLVYIAEVYAEWAGQIFKQNYKQQGFRQSELNNTIQEKNKKALECYKRAFAMKNDSPSILRMIGHGIMYLPWNIKQEVDNDFALDCLLRSIRLSEHQMTLYTLGTYYQRHVKDFDLALHYFEKSAKLGNHRGLKGMVHVKWQLGKLRQMEFNLTEDLEAALGWETSKRIRTELLVQLGSYYLFIERDFLPSLKYFNQILDEDPEYNGVFKSLYLRMEEPINLYECLANEAMLFLQNAPDDPGNTISSLLDKIRARDNSDNDKTKERLENKNLDPSFIDNLLKKSEELVQREISGATNRSNQFRLCRSRGEGMRNMGYNNRKVDFANQSHSDMRNQEGRFQNRNTRSPSQHSENINWRQEPRLEHSNENSFNRRSWDKKQNNWH